MERDTVETIPPSLQPLKNSHEFDQLEHDLKQMFIDLFEDYLRAGERDLNVYGAPHLGSFDLVSESVKSDGLSLINNDDEPAMRYLHKAWRGRNPKRGLHFLRSYLQLLFKDSWRLEQLWQSKALPYPTKLATKQLALSAGIEGYFLTSRIRASITDSKSTRLDAIIPAVRAALPARFVLEMDSLAESSVTPEPTKSAFYVRKHESRMPSHLEHKEPSSVIASASIRLFGNRKESTQPAALVLLNNFEQAVNRGCYVSTRLKESAA